MGVKKNPARSRREKRGDVLQLNGSIYNARAVWRTVVAGAVYDPAPLWQSVALCLRSVKSY